MTQKILMHHQTLLSKLEHPIFAEKNIEVWIKRDDLNHPRIQGNKWHKLKYNLQAAHQQAKTCLVTFGGAYSNHIAASAAAGKQFGFETHGYIRGDELSDATCWCATLRQADIDGMQLHFLDRATYRQKHKASFLAWLNARHPNAYILPEGGTNTLAIQGFAETCQDLDTQCPDWTHLYTAVGTGGTLAGLINHTTFRPDRKIIGVSTLKQSGYLFDEIVQWLSDNRQLNEWLLLTKYHGGGYAKSSNAMTHAQQWFEQTFNTPLDPIYTQKMVYAFMTELEQNKIPKNAKIILYHSGGLQGRHN